MTRHTPRLDAKPTVAHDDRRERYRTRAVQRELVEALQDILDEIESSESVNTESP